MRRAVSEPCCSCLNKILLWFIDSSNLIRILRYFFLVAAKLALLTEASSPVHEYESQETLVLMNIMMNGCATNGARTSTICMSFSTHPPVQSRQWHLHQEPDLSVPKLWCRYPFFPYLKLSRIAFIGYDVLSTSCLSSVSGLVAFLILKLTGLKYNRKTENSGCLKQP